ncbi:MAG: SDR family oxidoreductase [Gemmatimonadetes bacterium]|nr:SDR family oxidoreductase [Gemmatimonadota bacterium]
MIGRFRRNKHDAGANGGSGLLAGRTALVTGGGRNIGRSIALEMAREGAVVLIADIDADRTRQVVSELDAIRQGAQSFVFDLSREEECEKLCTEIANRKSPVDILVNNIGSSGRDLADDEQFDRARWQKMFDTNVFGSLSLSAAFAKRLQKEKSPASILFLSSIHQWLVRRIPSYSASKAAVGMLVKEMAVEYAAAGIRVNGIAPGYVESTPKGEPVPHRHTPLHGTSIPPEYIGRAAVYLASDRYSRYTTGSMLAIDAGLSLYNHLGDSKGRRR